MDRKTPRLPDGQYVLIRDVFDDGFASVMRLAGPERGIPAVCLLDKLTVDAPDDLDSQRPRDAATSRS